MITRDPGPGGGRRDHRDDGCWFTALAGACAFAAVVLLALGASRTTRATAHLAQEASQSE